MNDLRLSSKELIAAAKADMPSAAARAKMWAGVSGAVGGVAAASGATASAFMGGGATATKLLTMGALFGGTLSVGLAAVLLQIVPPPAESHSTGSAQVVLAGPARSEHGGAVRPSSAPPPSIHPPALVPVSSQSVGATVHGPAATHPAPRHAKALSQARDDSLAREASLVADARSALGRGDPRLALRTIRAARALPSKQLVPEELAVEELALRAVGQSDEANGIDVMLRLQYPEAALAR